MFKKKYFLTKIYFFNTSFEEIILNSTLMNLWRYFLKFNNLFKISLKIKKILNLIKIKKFYLREKKKRDHEIPIKYM